MTSKLSIAFLLALASVQQSRAWSSNHPFNTYSCQDLKRRGRSTYMGPFGMIPTASSTYLINTHQPSSVFREFDDMVSNSLSRRAIDQIFDDLDSFSSPFSLQASPLFNSALSIDISEGDGQYDISVDVPGYKKEEIQLTLLDNTLTISVTKNKEIKENNSLPEEGNKSGKEASTSSPSSSRFKRTERFSGKASRSFMLPDDALVDHKAIKAELENGVLKVVVPKQPLKLEAKAPKTIDIQVK